MSFRFRNVKSIYFTYLFRGEVKFLFYLFIFKYLFYGQCKGQIFILIVNKMDCAQTVMCARDNSAINFLGKCIGKLILVTDKLSSAILCTINILFLNFPEVFFFPRRITLLKFPKAKYFMKCYSVFQFQLQMLLGRVFFHSPSVVKIRKASFLEYITFRVIDVATNVIVFLFVFSNHQNL